MVKTAKKKGIYCKKGMAFSNLNFYFIVIHIWKWFHILHLFVWIDIFNVASQHLDKVWVLRGRKFWFLKKCWRWLYWWHLSTLFWRLFLNKKKKSTTFSSERKCLSLQIWLLFEHYELDRVLLQI